MQQNQTSQTNIRQAKHEKQQGKKNNPEDKKSEEEEQQEQGVGFCEMFRFATQKDILLMVLGSICAGASGAAMPAFALLWGDMTDSFADGSMVDAAKQILFKFIYIGLGSLVAGWGMFACWMITGERQAIQCRKQYFKSLLRQQIGWFDQLNQSELSTKFATDCFAFQNAIGEKVSTILMTIAMFIAGFAIAFYTGWLMSLVVLATIPAIGITGFFFMAAAQGKDKQLEQNYSEAGGNAEQSIAAMKTVKQLNGEEFEAVRYEASLADVAKKSFKYAVYAGMGIGGLFFAMIASYSLGFWFGSTCVEGTSECLPHIVPKYSAGDTIVIFFSILMAGFNLSQLTPALKKIAQGRSAAARIFKIVDREPEIKSKENAVVPQEFHGIFKFENVTFSYPKDKKKNIIQSLNLDISENNVAFVGESGCGKSTIFQLLMRFYDPDQGRITLDGVDLKDLNLSWLRQQIGYVGQEPVLFATTIKQNLMFGKENASEEDIFECLRKAEAYDFIMNELKDKLETYVGTGGGQISGGQKQRIAIARALLKNPKMLLLDEATSALDRKNQKLIQTTLNDISKNQKTFTIAHRITTIMSCDLIYVLDKGGIVQHGRFNELKRYQGQSANYNDDLEEQAKSTRKVKLQPLSPTKSVKEGKLDLIGQMEPLKKIDKDKKEGEQEENKSDVDLTPEQKQQKAILKKYEEEGIFSRLFSYAEDRKCTFFFGIVFAILNGLVFPIFSIFLGRMLSILLNFKDNPSQARSDVNLYAIIFLILAIISFFTNTFQMTLFSVVGEQITRKIRGEVFRKILHMPIPWFDKEKNSSGALTARLASDCENLNGLTTTYIGITIQNIATLLAGIVIAFTFEWRTSAVALGLLPLMVIAGIVQMQFTVGFSSATDKAYKQSSNLITESTLNIRTVTSFGYEEMIQRKYAERLDEPLNNGIKKGNVSGILFGISQFVMFIVFGLIFYLGTIFSANCGASIEDVFVAIYSIMFAGMTVGNNSHFMPDIGAATNSAVSIFVILDSEDEDQMQAKGESKLLKSPIKGNIEFKNVAFQYETRQDQVFKNMNFTIREGQKVAFVGSSGCGKSTIMSLLLRYYKETEGQILVDGIKIDEYDIHYLRSQFGVVSQEPVLFNDTIGNNIKYNKEDANKDDIIAAANQSNFNPEDEQEQGQFTFGQEQTAKGFNKNVGVKGTHISGGQKQRVAIARAILRNPNMLLLDEATSALDTKNEKIVQESLDRVMKNKTTISIAHRIDTIKNADEILVFEKGEIVERGGYKELVDRRGYFYKLEKGIEFV